MTLHPDRFFDPNPHQRDIARELYRNVKNLPLICPHGHVDPRLFTDPDYSFGTPVDLLIIPDHYIFRMLYSQGMSLESVGVPRRDGGPVETDHRKIWRAFASSFYLFRGTPTGIWLQHELEEVFGIERKLDETSADEIYNQIAEKLESSDFRPRKMFEDFNIEVLCTTDFATDTLEHHKAVRESGWDGTILPTFRPDDVVNLDRDGWRENIDKLSQLTGVTINSYKTYIEALEIRRAFFKEMGAKATDHAAVTPYTERLAKGVVEAIFQRALHGEATQEDAERFTAHMLVEMARMSSEDGLVMQIHPGSIRNHNKAIYDGFGFDMGADIPQRTEYTHNLKVLLNEFGNSEHFRLILFTLDETTYGRELAPLAGHYPAIKLGPPWWFFDSLNGMRRYFDEVMETAGLYNTAGFNDDTRAYPSIPARHDVWRRASADWLAGLVVRNIIDQEDAESMSIDVAYGLAKQAYNLD